MNLADARTELAGRGFDYLSASRMNYMLNRARNDFEDFWTWPWLEKTATGPAPLSISDLKYVLLVKDADSHNELLGLDPRDVGQGDGWATDTGTPAYWWIADTSNDTVINVYPVAPITLAVSYVSQSDELVDSQDTPHIPARYHTLWIDLAVVQAYKDSDNFTAASALHQDALARLQQLVERYETRNRQNPALIQMRAYNEDD